MLWVTGFWPLDRRLTIEPRCFLGGLIRTTALHGRSPGLLTTRLYTDPIREEISRRTRASSTWALPGAEMPSGTRKCPLVRLLLTLFLGSSCEFSKGLPFPLGGCSHPNQGRGRVFQEASPAGSRHTTHTDLSHGFQTSLPRVYFMVEPGSRLNSMGKHHL